MHIDELQSIVRRLSNSSWVRWWANFDCRATNVRMAIQVLDVLENGAWAACRVKDLEVIGFAPLDDNKDAVQWFYTIPRTNLDGSPYESMID